MEFSFDRSKDSHLRKSEGTQTPSQGTPPPRPDMSHAGASAVRPGPDLNSQDPSTIANERLRKAIERNRAKQAAQAGGRPVSTPPSQSNFSQAQAEAYHQQHSLFSEPQRAPQAAPMQAAPVREEVVVEAQPAREQAREAAPQQPEVTVEAPKETPREMPRARERLSARLNTANRQAVREAMQDSASETVNNAVKETAVVSRRSVAKPEDTEFVPTVKRTPKKVASQISYTTNSTRKKAKSVDPKYTTWLVKGSWIFCGIMVLRLIFAAGGVTDYYSQRSTMNERVTELNDIKKENMQLVRDIERMKTDIGFQKKLVRDNLGFIASDEFLVLFPKEK